MDIIRAQEQSRDLHESFHNQVIVVPVDKIFEPCHEKTRILHIQKQRRELVAQSQCS